MRVKNTGQNTTLYYSIAMQERGNKKSHLLSEIHFVFCILPSALRSEALKLRLDEYFVLNKKSGCAIRIRLGGGEWWVILDSNQ